MFFYSLPVAAALIAIYLIHEAWENYLEERWVTFWLDIAFAVPFIALMVLCIPGVYNAILHWFI